MKAAGIAAAEFSAPGGSMCRGLDCRIDVLAPSAGGAGRCAESETISPVTVVADGCRVHVVGGFRRQLVGGRYVCVGIGSGSMQYTDPLGVVYPTVGVQLVVTDGAVRISNAGLFVGLVMYVDAMITNACNEGGIFAGTVSRVHV